MKRIRIFLLSVWIAAITVTGATAEYFNETALSGLTLEQVHVNVPGCSRTYRFLWISDLHIVIDNEEIAEEQRNMVRNRQTAWAVRSDGMEAGNFWVEELARRINAAQPDAVFFGGDMVDLCSEATIEKLKEGLDQITVPWMYIRADHDVGTHWLKEPDQEKNRRLQAGISDDGEILTLEYPEFIVLGINYSTSPMSDEAVDEAKAISEKGKPIIVLTHVPYDSRVDGSLGETSRIVWQDRNLTWGEDTNYVPGEKMKEWMEIVYVEDSPVTQVFAGHLHLSWDGMIAEGVHEHVFSPAYNGFVGLITVDGAE